MRFHVALDSLEKENKFLRIAVIALLILSIFFCLGIIRSSQKTPLLVERGCETRAIQPTDAQTSESEVTVFLNLALEERFNSKSRRPLFLSGEQSATRAKEQSELSRQNLKQAIVVNEVIFKDKDILVDADRLISVGEIRSAFKFPIKVRVQSVTRTTENPYGLLLVSVLPNDPSREQ